jgi:hypothetical protein
LWQTDRRLRTDLFRYPNFLAPLLGAPPNTGIRDRQPADFLQNLFRQIVFDLPVEPDRLPGDGFTPIDFIGDNAFGYGAS